MKTSALWILLLGVVAGAAGATAEDDSAWTVYVANDNCPDYTWGLTEEQTRQAFADIVRAHLDEMNRTDSALNEDQGRYNAAVTQEVLCFVERYPGRKAELVRRVQEGRLFVSPFLCNFMWGFCSTEGAIRTLYPARRLEGEWGVSFTVAEHIEEPSLPWGMATILSGCGLRWLSAPFYNYDSTFGGLRNPPLFLWRGPDGSELRVIMDPWACQKASYAQGARLLAKPESIIGEWLPHYRALGGGYPLRAILASGTHSDIAPRSGDQARGFADAIASYNHGPPPRPRLFNATLPQFCAAADAAQEKQPFLQQVRGCFGHSWDLWPVSLARQVADLRAGEHAFLAAETLAAVLSMRRPQLAVDTRSSRERAEWCWAMLSDHAWNGTDDANKRLNAALRRSWSRELNQAAVDLENRAWETLSLTKTNALTLFNPLSFSRRELVQLDLAEWEGQLGGMPASQVVYGDGSTSLCFVSPSLRGFGFAEVQTRFSDKTGETPPVGRGLRGSRTELESPFYRLRVDLETGGLVSLLDKPTGAELVVTNSHRTLCQTVYHDGQEHTLSNVTSVVADVGQVFARLRISGETAGIHVISLVTVYAELDRVDFDVRIAKPLTSRQERLCQVFPVARDLSCLRIETPGAVIRPSPQPEGDLLPGADTKRFAVQGFVDVSPPNGPGLTIAPLDAFALRTDLDPLTFEALGNDQNYKEVTQHQAGATNFRFRYALRAHRPGYRQAEVLAWSRSVANPVLAASGRLPRDFDSKPLVTVDPGRALVLCLKPSDAEPGRALMLRLWETAGESTDLLLGLSGWASATQSDLIERPLKPLSIRGGQVEVATRPLGFSAVSLQRQP